MEIIAERLLKYYNDLIQNNVIVVEGPVTLEWLKRQRIVEGREELDIRFGHVVVDSVLGEKTYLAKAADMLVEVNDRGKYELLPNIACMLSWECDTMLDLENPVREKYSFLDSQIPIPIFEMPNEVTGLYGLNRSIRNLSIQQFEVMLEAVKHQKDPFRAYFYRYIQEAALCVLQIAFKEIKAEVEVTIK